MSLPASFATVVITQSWLLKTWWLDFFPFQVLIGVFQNLKLDLRKIVYHLLFPCFLIALGLPLHTIFWIMNCSRKLLNFIMSEKVSFTRFGISPLPVLVFFFIGWISHIFKYGTIPGVNTGHVKFISMPESVKIGLKLFFQKD